MVAVKRGEKKHAKLTSPDLIVVVFVCVFAFLFLFRRCLPLLFLRGLSLVLFLSSLPVPLSLPTLLSFAPLHAHPFPRAHPLPPPLILPLPFSQLPCYVMPISGRYDVGGLQSYVDCNADFERTVPAAATATSCVSVSGALVLLLALAAGLRLVSRS